MGDGADMAHEKEDDSDRAFTEASDAMMQAIESFREAGLSNDDIKKELDARLH